MLVLVSLYSNPDFRPKYKIKNYVFTNQVLSRLVKNSDYVGYDLSYWEFKAIVNVFLKNRKHGLKLLIEVSEARPNVCLREHWENMVNALLLQMQNKVRQLRIMPLRVQIRGHSCHGGEVGIVGKLVSSYLHYPCHISSTCVIMLVARW
jgi:hypothetical protein